MRTEKDKTMKKTISLLLALALLTLLFPVHAVSPYSDLPDGYEMDDSIRDIKVRSSRRDYTVTIRHKSRAEMDLDAAWEAYRNGEITHDELIMMDFWLTMEGPSYRKNQLLFGDRDRDFFESRAEADANMTTVTVPVWRLEGGSKVSGTAGVTVHQALADDVLAIFTEIYNDPEQFPIHDLGGYSWRGVGVSEHSSGTAIDINSDQNCQMKGGTVVAGSYWKPGEDPYSIPADGSVVRIFRAHGWTWGGAAWESSVDYMHFSYLGM